MEPLAPIETLYCDHCKSALRNDEWYRERERHMADSYVAGYSIKEIAGAYNRPLEWVRKTIVNRMGMDVFTTAQRDRSLATPLQQPKEMEEQDYDGDQDSR